VNTHSVNCNMLTHKIYMYVYVLFPTADLTKSTLRYYKDLLCTPASNPGFQNKAQVLQFLDEI
jgi:hypothetical protein